MTETAESSTTASAPRRLRFHVLRHDPRDPQSVAHTELFELEEAAGMTLFIALKRDEHGCPCLFLTREQLRRRWIDAGRSLNTDSTHRTI